MDDIRLPTEQDVYEWVSFAASATKKSSECMARALVLRYGDRNDPLSFDEIARDMGVSPVGAYQYVRRGLALLRTAPRFHRMKQFPNIEKTRLWRAVQFDYLPEVREN